MRPRKWILLFLFFVLAFSIIFWETKKWLEKNRSLEKIVTAAISSAIKGECKVEKIRVGFFSFSLRDVSISLPLELITIKLKEVKSGLSIVKLLKYKGDITRSISSIVFIKPHIFIYVKGASSFSKDSLTLPTNFFDNSKTSSNSLVQEIVIKDGVVGILVSRDDTLLVAEKLSGRMNSSYSGINLRLDGRFGSIRKNFYIDIFSHLLNDSTTFSICLRNASLNKHIVINQNKISRGIIDGEIDGSLVGYNFPEGIDIRGWLRIYKGEGTVAFKSKNLVIPISSLETDILFKGKEIELKEAKALVRGILVSADGTYNFYPGSKAEFNFRCEKIFSDSLYGIISDSLLRIFCGEMEAKSTLRWDKKEGFDINFSFIGGKVKNIILDKIKIKGKFLENIFTLENIEIKTPFFTARSHGKIYLSQPEKNLNLKFTIKSDSFPAEYCLKGNVFVKGSVSLPFSKFIPTGEATIFTKDIVYKDFYIGSPSFLINLKKNQSVSIKMDTISDISFEGTIDSLLSSSPFITFSAQIGNKAIKNYLERNNKIPFFDSIKLSLKGKGELKEIDVSALLNIKGRDWVGNIEGKILGDLNSKVLLKWKATTNDFKFKNYPLLIKAEGRVLDSIITIDNISDEKGVSGRFNIYVLSNSPYIEGYLECNKDLSEYLEILKDNNLPIEKGKIKGRAIIRGDMRSLSTKASIKIEGIGNDFIDGLYSNIYLESKGNDITVYPTVIRLDTTQLLFLDTLKIKDSALIFNGKIEDVPLEILLKKILPAELNIDGKISGNIYSTDKDCGIKFVFFSPNIMINSINIDSIICKGYFTSKGINIEKFLFKRDTFLNFKCEGFSPWSTFSEHSGDKDTLHFSIKAEGDFLAAIEKSIKSPIGGSGKGSAEISFYTTEGNWVFTKGAISIPEGLLKVKPFVPDNVKKFNFSMRIDSNGIVHTNMSGFIKKRPIRVFSEHYLPDGYEPFVIGPLNFGVLQVVTPQKGVDLHLVGFMAIKEKGDIEFKGKEPFPYFTLSGPLDRIKITGVWIVRDIDFTFPLLKIEKLDYNLDPFPYVTWELDVYPGNRKVMYFWDVTGKKNRLIRFLECYVDPSSFLKVRGRDLDKTFRVYGSLRSYRGAFYYGKIFNRNFEIGVDFVPIKKDDGSGYDNMPILWGSAEAFSDSSRFDRIKITCMVEDPLTGTVSEKGRLKEQFPPNIIFNLSSNFEGIPDETELEFYRSAGIKFSSIGGTGSAVSDLGEQLFHTYLLQKWERFIAKKLGLDVMNIETSIVSNYFNKLYSRRFTSLFDETDYLAFANIGVTIGRYFFKDYLLLKARSELIPVDMMLTPEYSIGFELQPSKYFIMDINYGINIRESKILHSPLLMMQLRLPISSMRKFFNF